MDTPLVAGVPYVCRFRVSLGDSVNFALGSMGVYVSIEDTRYWNYSGAFFNMNPQIQNPVNELLDDKEQWMTISGQFVAQGEEKYVTIGSFVPDSMGNIQRVSNFPQIGENWESSSYLVDGVELYADTSTTVIEDNRPVVSIVPTITSNTLQINHATPLSLHLYDLTGKAVLTEQLQGGKAQVDVSHLQSSIYLAVFTNNKGERHTEKVVIQH